VARILVYLDSTGAQVNPSASYSSYWRAYIAWFAGMNRTRRRDTSSLQASLLVGPLPLTEPWGRLPLGSCA
jgi:hypothetical protein